MSNVYMQLIYFDRVVLNSVSVLGVACLLNSFVLIFAAYENIWSVCLCVCRGRVGLDPAPHLTLVIKNNAFMNSSYLSATEEQVLDVSQVIFLHKE